MIPVLKIAPRNRIVEMRMPVIVNKVLGLTKAFMLLVSDTCFHGSLIHFEASERQNVQQPGEKRKDLEKELQNRMRSQEKNACEGKQGRKEKDPERGDAETAREISVNSNYSVAFLCQQINVWLFHGLFKIKFYFYLYDPFENTSFAQK